VTQSNLTYEEAKQICLHLFDLVPFPNNWKGNEIEQLTFGKGIVEGARRCAKEFDRLASAQQKYKTTTTSCRECGRDAETDGYIDHAPNCSYTNF